MPKRKTPSKSKASETVAAGNDYSKKTVAQLRAQCEEQGLDSSGKKQDLVNRLQNFDSGEDGPTPKMQKQSTMEKAMVLVKERTSGQTKKKKKKAALKLDEYWYQGGTVHEEYSCMLNQTNIGNNNNKYYVIQIIHDGTNYHCFNRWGRVGEPGANATRSHSDVKEAIKDFEKKFKDKTKNDWSKRNKFTPVQGKYTLLEMEEEEDEPPPAAPSLFGTKPVSAKPGSDLSGKGCSLDKATQSLLKLVFDHDMFKDTMTSMNLDMQKMPLGKLSKTQVLKGFQVLGELQQAIEGTGSRAKKEELSSKFYTLIPQNFGRQRPPIIDNKDSLKKNADLLVTLGDIAEALEMQQQQEVMAKTTTGKHPLDLQYELVGSKLELVAPSEQEFKMVKKYFDATKGTSAGDDRASRLGGGCWARSSDKFLHLWRVDRKNEGDRFSKHKSIVNRKLLWHGTKAAVGAAIMKGGLRIMPQSCAGLYFGSECSTSLFYAPGSYSDDFKKTVSMMFLNEVALGKEYHRGDDDWDIKKQAGYDSVVKRGKQEPDEKCDTMRRFDGHDVVIPQGKPVDQPKWIDKSEVLQSEYVVHAESQVRIRYLMLIEN